MRYRFDMDGMFVFYFGNTLGEALEAFIKHRPKYIKLITAITPEPVKEYEKP